MQNPLQNRYIFIKFAYIKIGHCPKINSKTNKEAMEKQIKNSGKYRTIIHKKSYGINLNEVLRKEFTQDLWFKIQYDMLESKGQIVSDPKEKLNLIQDINNNLIVYFKTPKTLGKLLISDIEVHYGGDNKIILEALNLIKD